FVPPTPVVAAPRDEAEADFIPLLYGLGLQEVEDVAEAGTVPEDAGLLEGEPTLDSDLDGEGSDFLVGKEEVVLAHVAEVAEAGLALGVLDLDGEAGVVPRVL